MANMFLKLGDIKGEARDVRHKGQIELDSWKWDGKGIQNNAPYNLEGKKPDDPATHTKVENISVTKWCDHASVTLAQYCALGTPIEEGVISCLKNKGENLEQQTGMLQYSAFDYLVIIMKRVMIRSIVLQVNHNDTITETVELNFEEFKIEYKGQADDDEQEAVGCNDFGFDIKNHRKT